MKFKVYEGTKATINGGLFTFDCDPYDIDTAYDALAENVQLNNQNQDDNQDLVDFQNAEDDDVETLLNDMKKMGFIGDWEVLKMPKLNELVKNAIVKYDNEKAYIKENKIAPTDWKEWKEQGYSDDGYLQIMDCYYLAGNATTGNMVSIASIDEITNLLIEEMDDSDFNDVIGLLNDDCENPEDKININDTYECLEAFLDYCHEIAIFKQSEGTYKDHYCLVIEY